MRARDLAIAAVALAVIFFCVSLLTMSSRRSMEPSMAALPRSWRSDPLELFRRLEQRLRVADQLVAPLAGATASDLTFRDRGGKDLRARFVPELSTIVLERRERAEWIRDPDSIPDCAAFQCAGLIDGGATLAATLTREGQSVRYTAVVKPGSMALECATVR